jgi:hypothetical protein
MPGRDDVLPTEESITRLHRSGWSRGETAGTSIAGRIVFQVNARCGGNQILVPADARRKAWHRALEAAAAVEHFGHERLF